MVTGNVGRSMQGDVVAGAGAEGPAQALWPHAQPVAIRRFGRAGRSINGFEALSAGLMLPWHPPAARFPRVGAIRNVENDVDIAPVSRHSSGEVNIAASGIQVPVRAGSAGLEMAELPRIHRVSDIPDQHAFAEGRIGIASEIGKGLLESSDHRIARQIHLKRPCIWDVVRDELGDLGSCRIGYVDDAPAGMPEVTSIQIPPAPDFADRHLERGPMVEICIPNRFDIVRVGAGRRHRALAHRLGRSWLIETLLRNGCERGTRERPLQDLASGNCFFSHGSNPRWSIFSKVAKPDIVCPISIRTRLIHRRN